MGNSESVARLEQDSGHAPSLPGVTVLSDPCCAYPRKCYHSTRLASAHPSLVDQAFIPFFAASSSR
jgi:hypothetical protein